MRNTLLKKIENLFEPEMIFEQFSFLAEKNNNFEIEDNFKLIENIGYFGQSTSSNSRILADTVNWTVYFSRLAPFFEFGLLFKNNALDQAFYTGQCHDCSAANVKMTLPTSNVFNVYKTDSKSFLKKIKIHTYFDTTKTVCHFVRVQSDVSFVLFSKKAEPWNKLLIESLQKSLINYSL